MTYKHLYIQKKKNRPIFGFELTLLFDLIYLDIIINGVKLFLTDIERFKPI